MTIQDRIAELVAQHGSLRNVAAVLRMDVGYLSRLASGEKTEPGAVILRRMGLVRHVTYARKAASTDERSAAPTPLTGATKPNVPDPAPSLEGVRNA